MKVEFLDKFCKDIDRLNDGKVKLALKQVILRLEEAETLSEIRHLKKLKGHSIAYRVRVGEYRLGFYFENGVIELARFVHRKDIYSLFP